MMVCGSAENTPRVPSASSSPEGPSIYDVPKNQVFDPLPLSTCAGPPPPCGRPHAVDMKYTSLSQLVQWPSEPKTEIRYMIVIYLKLYY